MELGPMANFVYLIGDMETKECAVVDPGWDVPAILKAAEGMNLDKIFITHGHPDHTNGVIELVEKKNCKIYIQKSEIEFWKFQWPSVVMLNDGDIISVGKRTVRAIHTPGHTPGSQCLEVDGHLLTGDTLFVNNCGRVDLPGSNPAQMYESLAKLRKLDEKTILLPGHNYASEPTSTIGQEKKSNPFLRFQSSQEFLSFMR